MCPGFQSSISTRPPQDFLAPLAASSCLSWVYIRSLISFGRWLTSTTFRIFSKSSECCDSDQADRTW